MSASHTDPQPTVEDYRQALKSMDSFIDISVEDLMTLAARATQFAHQRVIAADTIATLMTQPVATVHSHTPLTEAAHLLVSQRISGLPVVNDANRLVGIITEADFLRVLGVPAIQPSHSLWHTLDNLFTHTTKRDPLQAPNESIARHMVTHVITAHPTDKVQAVLDLMKKHQVKRVVIVDDDQQVCGIVTRSNLVRLFFDTYLRKEIADPGV
ncbi:CBS domain-containing protein [Thiothrix lacustris]|uniref:CBS domain-containing protein n=1 Tax=Thiothrix lacustris TaxID=525917 RepID=UPI0027E4B8ED|nr:CBS domain-containing protein [Thiothrix lacustris]WMP18750.1 CBS domain-containing protein [Thiothrix lacustris]